MELSSTLLYQAANTAHTVSHALGEFYGDRDIPTYQELPDDERAKLANAIKLTITQGLTAEQSHNNWVEMKRAAGWVHGDEYNVMRKTHPDIKPYIELDDNEKVKDHIFIAIARSFFPNVKPEDMNANSYSEPEVVKADNVEGTVDNSSELDDAFKDSDATVGVDDGEAIDTDLDSDVATDDDTAEASPKGDRNEQLRQYLASPLSKSLGMDAFDFIELPDVVKERLLASESGAPVESDTDTSLDLTEDTDTAEEAEKVSEEMTDVDEGDSTDEDKLVL